MLHSRALRIWAKLAGIGLFVPALGLPGLHLPLQPLDALILCGLPLCLYHLRWVDRRMGLVAISLALSLLLSLLLASGQALAAVHGFLFALPFLMLSYLVMRSAHAREALLRGLIIGGAISLGLFFAQIIFGAERLDYRSNPGFSLPPQYGRGFALFPEVSTFASHMNLLLALCLTMALHPATQTRTRRRFWWLALTILTALMLSRSTSFLLVAPLLCVLAVAQVHPLRPALLMRLMLAAVLAAGVLYAFVTGFYAERLESASASRSIQMRLASILAGLSPLWQAEYFGVGLGNNHEIARRAYDIAHALDLRFGQLPTGVNSQIVARIFEEGWPAILNLMAALAALITGLRHRFRDPVMAALMVFAAGSALTAGMITGYRAIYTNWLWLSVPAGLLADHLPVRRRTTPTVRHRIPRSSRIDARRA